MKRIRDFYTEKYYTIIIYLMKWIENPGNVCKKIVSRKKTGFPYILMISNKRKKGTHIKL